ncbi:rifin [Plasmodium reichenowi]|uniref:Rifin n=1 Tax=Plasmodium reichenowi TaxID=5854 RepID=A0A060RLZ7_PLARE|nr:rifin [Plasmodium reichenowi]
MKLHYSKILLFFLPLNILVTLYAHNNKYKLYITPRHTARYTSRVLSEKDIQSSIYDKDADIISVKEKFDRQTSQRFEEYQERMKEKRQKRKEQSDKNIEEIIKKDKMDKSLEEKIEKVCLKCGCGLGGVAASVGIFGTVAVKEKKKKKKKKCCGSCSSSGSGQGCSHGCDYKSVGAEAGKKFVIEELQKWGVLTLDKKALVSYFTTTDYTNSSLIYNAILVEYRPSSCILPIGGSGPSETFCTWVKAKSDAAMNIAKMTQGNYISTNEVIRTSVESIVSKAETVAGEAAKKATEDAIKASIVVVDAKYASCQTSIIASVVAILIIVLVMIIIYLVLRYRRKKKMKKKSQYTKLLNQ